MEIIITIILGALSGWIASIIMGTNAKMGALLNIIVGVVGASIGSYIMGLFGNEPVGGFSLYSLGVSVLGAVILLFIVKLILGGKK